MGIGKYGMQYEHLSKIAGFGYRLPSYGLGEGSPEPFNQPS